MFQGALSEAVVLVGGSATPGDGSANPTDAQDVFALGAVWNGATWDRARSAGATGVAAVGGAAASGVAVAGNPLLVGGRVSTSVPSAATTGQAKELWQGRDGSLVIAIPPGGGADAKGSGLFLDAGGSTIVPGVLSSAWNGANVDRLRTPSTFKTATATAAGDTAVWTPQSGKKFRLMAYVVYVTANAAQSVAGLIEIVLRDATTPIGLGYSVFVPGAAGTTFVDSSESGWAQLGNGFLSAAANNVLNVNLTTAFTAGEVRVVAIGTEE